MTGKGGRCSLFVLVTESMGQDVETHSYAPIAKTKKPSFRQVLSKPNPKGATEAALKSKQ